VISCRKFAENIGAVFLQSGEIAQRHAERKGTPAGGPAELINVMTFEPEDEPKAVWSSGDVKVSAIRSAHIPGHASYRVDTPAGSVVISGDASNDKPAPPRPYSTSDQVERLAKDADVLVHATTHPNMGPEKGGGMPAPIFYRQSTATDVGAMAKRAGVKIYMTTHLTPSLGEVDRIDKWKITGAPLNAADFRKAVEEGGFTGTTIVGTDLANIRLPAK
jgi:ribonuclease Z